MAKGRKEFSEDLEKIQEVEEIEEVKSAPTEPEPVKPYINIDTFLQTAMVTYDMSRMQVVGFKVYMAGRHYQYDEQVFVDELKKYLEIH